MMIDDRNLRQAMIEGCRHMTACGINQGTSGNISVRAGETMLITPSAIPYDAMTPDMIAAMPLDGDYGAWSGPRRPSTEWRFHLDILLARPEVGAVVHAHPTYCTALAMARRPIPACHYMIAAFGGADVRCTDYALFGTAALSDLAVAGLADRTAVLLGNHGMITLGATLDAALWRAVELEAIARQYWHALQIGGPRILTDAEVAEALSAFEAYGAGAGPSDERIADAAPAPQRPRRRTRAKTMRASTKASDGKS